MAGAAEGAHHLQRFAIEDVDLLIRTVGHDEERLIRIDREADVPDRSAAERLLRDEGFLHERPVLAEHLHAIVRAIADVDESVARDPHRVHDAKLRRRRAVRIVLARSVLVLHDASERTGQPLPRALEIPIVGPFAVRAPVTFVRTGRRVEHDDAVVDVPVGDVQFVGGGVEDNVGRRAEVLCVVAAAALTRVPDLHQELAGAREPQNVRVFLAAGAQPHVVPLVHIDAVLELRPIVAGARTAPSGQE